VHQVGLFTKTNNFPQEIQHGTVGNDTSYFSTTLQSVLKPPVTHEQCGRWRLRHCSKKGRANRFPGSALL